MENSAEEKKQENTEQISEPVKNQPSEEALSKKEKKRATIVTSIVAVCSILVGGFGGYVVFKWLHPTRTQLSGSTSEGYIPTDDEVQKQIDSGTILTDYADKAYQLINYSLSRQASYTYALTIGKATVVSSGITQSVVSTTYTTPEVIFNQNISSSSLVHTANRFYDYRKGTVESYLGSKADDWKTLTAVDDSYDDYMQKWGKLLKGSYYCTAETDTSKITEAMPIADRYLTDNPEEYAACTDSTKHHINGVVIYMIGPRTVMSSSVEKSATGYTLKAQLYTDKDKSANTDTNKKISAGNSYYSVQMRTTGGLASRPPFSLTQLTFEVDEHFDMVSSYFYDEYTAVVGPINSAATSDMYQYYFHSDSDTFNSVKVSVPDHTSTEEFTGYSLFPNE